MEVEVEVEMGETEEEVEVKRQRDGCRDGGRGGEMEVRR